MNSVIYWTYLLGCLTVVVLGVLLIIQAIGPSGSRPKAKDQTFDSKAWDALVGIKNPETIPTKITEAIEERVEMPNGVAVQKRSIRVWN